VRGAHEYTEDGALHIEALVRHDDAVGREVRDGSTGDEESAACIELTSEVLGRGGLGHYLATLGPAGRGAAQW
jgi:hypothetical protein